jgi:hypothetical protein
MSSKDNIFQEPIVVKVSISHIGYTTSNIWHFKWHVMLEITDMKQITVMDHVKLLTLNDSLDPSKSVLSITINKQYFTLLPSAYFPLWCPFVKSVH